MSKVKTVNRRIVSHPVGAPVADNFRLLKNATPLPSSGQVLLHTLYLSLDPYMRGRMADAPSYTPSVAIGEVMIGSTVSRVVDSRHPNFQPGDLVLGNSGWQDYALSDGTGLTMLDVKMSNPLIALGVLGMPGFTAYMGLLDIGQPQAGDTVVVAAASGAMGSVVGQIARLKGCRAVGIAGGAEKCRFVVDELGLDGCVDHRSGDFRQQLAAACPKGIDVYYDCSPNKVIGAANSPNQQPVFCRYCRACRVK
jgi:NADPH-dependent curcumin reductase CurA